MNRLRQRHLTRFVPTTPAATAYLPGVRAIHDVFNDNPTHADPAFLKYFDYVEFASERLFPRRSSLSVFNTIIADTNAARTAMGWGNAKYSAYMIAFEKGGQVNFGGTYTRSGTTLTINLVNVSSGASATAQQTRSSGTNVVMIGWNGSNGPTDWNGTKTLASASTFGSSTSLNITVANSGPTSGTADRGVMIAYQDTTFYVVAQHLATNPGAFLWKQGTSGRFTAWSTLYNMVDMNVSQAAWRDFICNDYYTAMSSVPLQGIFVDNWMDPRLDVINGGTNQNLRDFDANGTQESNTNTAVLTAWRTGQQALMNRLRSAGYGWTEGNYDSANGGGLPEGFGSASDKVFFENIDDPAAFSTQVDRIHACRPRLRTIAGEDQVVLGIEPGWSQKERIRFWIGTAWLFDKTVPKLMCKMSGTPYVPDEFKVGMGPAIDPEPTAADANGLWKRRFQNLYVVVNPQSTARNLDLTGTTWKRIAGTDDSIVNSGGTVNAVVSIPARCARLYVQNDPGI